MKGSMMSICLRGGSELKMGSLISSKFKVIVLLFS